MRCDLTDRQTHRPKYCNPRCACAPRVKNAVAVYLEDVVVGHVPHNIAPRFSQFLLRDINKAFAEVTGQKINRGVRYRLEVPCVYRLYGPKVYIQRMNELVSSSRTTLTLDGHKEVHILLLTYFLMHESLLCGRVFAGRLWRTKMYGCEGSGTSSVSVVRNSGVRFSGVRNVLLLG